MPGKLTATAVAAVLKQAKEGIGGKHWDGDGLVLDVQRGGRAYWIVRYTVPLTGKRRELIVGRANGPTPMTLAEARIAAEDARRKVRSDADPIGQRQAERAEARKAKVDSSTPATVRTFKDVATMFLTAHEPRWKNEKHRDQWRNTLDGYAYPHLGDVPVSDVGKGHVMAVLEPIWHRAPETASRLRGRLESILDYAKARGWRDGENPAAWRGNLKHVLPPHRTIAPIQHFPALPWHEVGGFMAELGKMPGISARALAFAILTAARSGEVRGMTWGEVDAKARVWTVPGARMKAKREHRVPLSDAAWAILAALHTENTTPESLVFPSTAKRGAALSDMSLTAVLRRMKRDDLTCHGFRSTFRDWCAEATSYPRDVAEAALAHILRDKTEAAYRRGDALEKRRRLMAEWAEYCARPAAASAEVVPIRASMGA